MTVCLEAYRERFGVSKVEREFAKALRQEPEEERFRIIQRLFWDPEVAHARVAFDLVRTCLTTRASLEKILEQGLEHGDAHTVSYWLEAVVHGLGFRRVVQVVRKNLETHPLAVIKAHYHLPKWLPRDNPGAVQAMREFTAELAEVVIGNAQLERLVGAERLEGMRKRLQQKAGAVPKEVTNVTGPIQ